MTTYCRGLAERIAPVLLANLTARTPYHDVHLFVAGDGAHDPWSAHPAFGNSFDWHSSVHSHRTALLVLPFLEGGAHATLLQALRTNLCAENLSAEQAYLRERPVYERPYGWAWLLDLAGVASQDDTVEAARGALLELAEQVATVAVAWMRALPMPVRHGVHSNTAFALALMLDAARALRFDSLAHCVEQRARDWFEADRDYPQAWERSGNDFLSPGLSTALLMLRVLDASHFATWWRAFLPNLARESALLTPVDVPAIADGHVVHLHGLNLSRAAALARIAARLEDAMLREAAHQLYAASVDAAYGDDYLSTHWLPTFAWDAARAFDVTV